MRIMRATRTGLQVCSSVVVALVVLVLPSAALGAEFHCSSGDVTCLIAAIQAANRTPAPDTIILAAGLYNLTAIDNSTGDFEFNGLPSITNATTIRGAGATTTIIQRDPALGDPFSGDPVSVPFRLLHIGPSGILSLESLTIQGGVALFGGAILNLGSLSISESVIRRNVAFGGGGGIANSGTLSIIDSEVVENAAREGIGGTGLGGGVVSGGILTVLRSTISFNGADGFGGLYVGGTAVVADSEISHNGAFYSGGGVTSVGNTTITSSTIAHNGVSLDRAGGLYVTGGVLRLRNVTITDNFVDSAAGRAGGILVDAGSVQLWNTILARNSSRGPGPEHGVGPGMDCIGVLTSLGNNVVGDTTDCSVDLLSSDQVGDPGLGTFVEGDRPGGGHIPLMPGSPAIDAADPAACPPRDQLGHQRADGDGDGRVACDTGAVEFVVDGDSDGIADGSDDCPNSNLAPTVVLGGHDTGVPNRVLPNGCTINDRLSVCILAATDSRRQSAFVRCLAQLVHDLKRSGLITGRETGSIHNLAGQVGHFVTGINRR